MQWIIMQTALFSTLQKLYKISTTAREIREAGLCSDRDVAILQQVNVFVIATLDTTLLNGGLQSQWKPITCKKFKNLLKNRHSSSYQFLMLSSIRCLPLHKTLGYKKIH